MLAVPAQAATDPFAFAGVIQGSYGPTWSHSDRMALLRWMGSHGLDTYIHAPKDDAYQRAQWRDPYPAADMADFAVEVAAARRTGVDWLPNVSPGFPLIPSTPGGPVSRDLCFSCPDDVAALEAKLEPFVKAGARSLMVSFDDVQKVSTHPEDAAAYGTGDTAYGEMNRDLLNTLQRHFRKRSEDFHLVTVLADYSGTSDTAYLQGVRSGKGLDRAIRVLWTGTSVVSPRIRATEARAYAKLVGHPRVGLWDNYPANDVDGNIADGHTVRLFTGPYAGRDRDLDSAVSGIVLNCMNQPWANRFVLGTLAAYTADPQHYQPEAAWRTTIRGLAQGSAQRAQALAVFAENTRSSPLDRRESLAFTSARDAFLAASGTPYWHAAARRVERELERAAWASAELPHLAPELQAEAARFVDQLGTEARVGRAALALLAAQRPTLYVHVVGDRLVGTATPPDPSRLPALQVRLETAQASSLLNPSFVFGDRVTPSLTNPTWTLQLYIGENRMDDFADAARLRTAAWLREAPLAASTVTLTVDGRAVPLAEDGSFSVPVGGGRHAVVVTDGAGHQTGERL
jgi:hyaluronoglucosaminidase